jgi:hypothetical protein
LLVARVVELDKQKQFVINIQATHKQLYELLRDLFDAYRPSLLRYELQLSQSPGDIGDNTSSAKNKSMDTKFNFECKISRNGLGELKQLFSDRLTRSWPMISQLLAFVETLGMLSLSVKFDNLAEFFRDMSNNKEEAKTAQATNITEETEPSWDWRWIKQHLGSGIVDMLAAGRKERYEQMSILTTKVTPINRTIPSAMREAYSHLKEIEAIESLALIIGDDVFHLEFENMDIFKILPSKEELDPHLAQLEEPSVAEQVTSSASQKDEAPLLGRDKTMFKISVIGKER